MALPELLAEQVVRRPSEPGVAVPSALVPGFRFCKQRTSNLSLPVAATIGCGVKLRQVGHGTGVFIANVYGKVNSNASFGCIWKINLIFFIFYVSF